MESTSDSNDDIPQTYQENHKKIKRYKMGLYKNYEKSYEYNVSPRTSAIWKSLGIVRHHCNTENNTGIYEGVRNAACTKDNCNNTAEQLGDCRKSDNKENDCRLAFSCKNKLNKFIKTGKDTIDLMNQCQVVYKISCNDCDATYVGQTKRQLQTRIKEHRTDINKKSGSPSVISEHRLNYNHDFKWNQIDVLDREPCFNKRLISEMIHIKRQNMDLNKQKDTELLPDTYLIILTIRKFPPL